MGAMESLSQKKGGCAMENCGLSVCEMNGGSRITWREHYIYIYFKDMREHYLIKGTNVK